MLNRLVTPAQIQLGVNLYCPSENAIYEVRDIQGDSLHPDVTLNRCLYDGNLSGNPIVINYDSMYANYLAITAYS